MNRRLSPRSLGPALELLCALGLCGSILAVSTWPLTALAGPAGAAESRPEVGDPAPDFTLPFATADTVVSQGVALKDIIKSGPLLLAFYPADWSPGCTKEVCTLRDSFDQLSKLKITVWAISGDNLFSHRAWAQFHKLQFRLLSDTKHEVARAYGTFDADRGFNRRTVFVVGADGKIKYVNMKYSVADTTDFHTLRAAIAGLK